MKRTIFMLLALLAGCFSMHAENSVEVGNAAIPQGNVGTIDIELNNNDDDFTGFQFQLTLPEGLSFVLDGENPKVDRTERMTDHMISSNASNGKFTCLSPTNAAFKGTSGALLKVYVKASEELAAGTA